MHTGAGDARGSARLVGEVLCASGEARVVDMSQQLADVLHAHVIARRADALRAGTTAGQRLWLFAERTGRPLDPHNVRWPASVAWFLLAQAVVAAKDDVTASIDLHQRAIEMATPCGDRLTEQIVRGSLLSVLARTDDQDGALASFVDTVSAWQINGDTWLAGSMGHLVALLARLGDRDGAARLYGAVARGIALDSLVPGQDVTVSAVREAMGVPRSLRHTTPALRYQAAGELARELIARARAALASDR